MGSSRKRAQCRARSFRASRRCNRRRAGWARSGERPASNLVRPTADGRPLAYAHSLKLTRAQISQSVRVRVEVTPAKVKRCYRVLPRAQKKRAQTTANAVCVLTVKFLQKTENGEASVNGREGGFRLDKLGVTDSSPVPPIPANRAFCPCLSPSLMRRLLVSCDLEELGDRSPVAHGRRHAESSIDVGR